jgi:hypothetical protein
MLLLLLPLLVLLLLVAGCGEKATLILLCLLCPVDRSPHRTRRLAPRRRHLLPPPPPQGLKHYGNKWRTIVDNYLPWRSPSDLKNYANQYLHAKLPQVVRDNSYLSQGYSLQDLLASQPQDIAVRWQRVKNMQVRADSACRQADSGWASTAPMSHPARSIPHHTHLPAPGGGPGCCPAGTQEGHARAKLHLPAGCQAAVAAGSTALQQAAAVSSDAHMAAASSRHTARQLCSCVCCRRSHQGGPALCTGGGHV